MKRTNSLKPSLLSLSVSTAVSALVIGGVPAVQAQEEIEEVVITGSRIVRRDYEANSPIVTVEASTFEERTGLNVESYLNQLPSFNPAASPTTMEDDIQPTAVNAVGIATISLRGFGPNRNLVLIDGKRPVPANAVMVADVNAIPSAMLERVEIISGGASAVYGADAIGGVTNFILRKNFQGLEFDVQRGETAAGDGAETRVSGVLGTDFEGGRGNITVAVEHYKREAAYERNRDFYVDQWRDPNQLTDDLFFYGSAGFNSAADRVGFVPTGAPNSPNDATMRALLGTPAGTGFHGTAATTHQYRFGPGGEVLAIQGANAARWQQLGLVDGQKIALVNTFDASNGVTGGTNVIQTLKFNDQEALASAPQERYSFFTSANYDVTDNLNVYTKVNFGQSKTHTRLYPTVPISGWEARATFNPTTDSPVSTTTNWRDPANIAAYRANPAAFANPSFIPTGSVNATGASIAGHPVPPEVAIMLLSRPDPAASWMVELFPDKSLMRRTTDNTNTYFQVEAGLNFDLPIKDWTGEVYVSHGEQNSRNVGKGNLSLQRWRAMVNQADWGRNSNQQANSAALGASNINFGTVPVHCSSGFYDTFFKGEVPASKDCMDAVYATLQSNSSNKQDVAELNFQGGLFDLPAGEVRGAIGYSWRDNATEYTPDNLQASTSSLDQVIGLYPSSFLDVSQDVADVYAELLVPVVNDLPFMQKLELELGFRTSEYEHTDNTETWKVLANWEVNDSLRVRGGFNRANRAPNLGELFLELQEIYTGTGGLFSDACSLRSNATYGAGGAAPDPVLTGEPQTQLAAGQTAAGAKSTYLICQAQMGAQGVASFYGPDVLTGGNPSIDQGATTFAAAGFANAWLQQIGNRDLTSETADTVSVGFVFAGAGMFESPWLTGFTGSVDWWKVDIEDAIQPYSADYAGWLCYGQTIVTNITEARAYINGPGKESCDKVVREPTRGGAIAKRVAFDNQATIETSGVDVALSWRADLQEIGLPVPGAFGVSTQATFLDYYRTKASPISIDVPVDWKGSLGPNLAGTNPGAYDYRLNTNFSYTLDKLSVNLNWRYLPSVYTAGKAYENAVISNNLSVAAGGAGTLLSFTPTEEIETDAYSMFSLSANYQWSEKLSIRAGIDNLLDEEPPMIGGTTGVTAAERTQRCAAGVPACANPGIASLPRSSLAANAGQFTGTKGYYDILGRSYFLGVKASF
jgi:iron complex outermembrane receptor protein